MITSKKINEKIKIPRIYCFACLSNILHERQLLQHLFTII